MPRPAKVSGSALRRVALLATLGLSTAACPSFDGRVCAGHGTCTEAEGGSVCQCEEGYQRADCSYANVCPGDCGGNGRCVMPPAEMKRVNPLMLGTCACEHGFGGERCTELTVHAAAPAGCDGFCMGHGKCVCGEAQKLNVTRRVRIFDEHGHAGQDATVTEEVRVDVRGERTTAESTCGCQCHKGYVGFLCEETDGSNCPNACSGRGTCGPDDACVCDAGFVGNDCSRAIGGACPSACSGHGSCLSPPVCACHQGYGGQACGELVALAPPPSPPPPPPASPPTEVGVAAQRAAADADVAARSINATAWPQYSAQAGALKSAAVLGSVEQPAAAAAPTQIQIEAGSASAATAAAGAATLVGSAIAPHAVGVSKLAARVAARQTGCSGRGYAGADGCVCADGYTGLTCETLAFACAHLSNCSGHGHCNQGMCTCEVGASGAACDTVRLSAVSIDGEARPCLHSCSGHGTCTSSRQCVCDRGYAGASCNVLARVQSRDGVFASLAAGFYATSRTPADAPTELLHACPNSCSGHGRCLPTVAPVARGQSVYGRAPPIHGGTASPLSSSSSAKGIASRLLARMGGHVVGDVTPLAPTSSAQPAPHAALATLADAPPVQCSCEPGYGGHDCSTALFTCAHNCSGAGLCAAALLPPTGKGTPTYVAEGAKSVAARAAPTCLCQRGHSGVGCEVRSASCPADCNGRGRCAQTTYGGVTSATCACAPGFVGASCADQCAAGCSGQGRCARAAAGLVCLCDSGRGGAACEREARCPSAITAEGVHAECAGRGECRSGVCSCSAGFHGHDCSRDGRDHTMRPSSCPSGCSGHGACLQGTTCACVAGYTGAECATRAVADAADAKLAAAVRARQGL